MMLSLISQSIRRWRMRLLGIAVLVALSFTLQILYSGFVTSAQSGKASATPKLHLPYDLMIVAAPGERILSAPELPEFPYTSNRRSRLIMVDQLERAVKLTADSSCGALNLLGLPYDSVVYHPSKLSIEGRWLEATGEIVLAQDWAEQAGLNLGERISVSTRQNHAWQKGLRYASFEIVGIYDSFDLQPALIPLEDALLLSAQGEANCCLLTYPRDSVQRGSEVDLDSLVQWMRPIYPAATFIEARLPEQISQNLLSRIYQPGQGLLLLIVVFMFVGVLTIAVMTYLERRKEFAALKTLGISKKQLLTMFAVENSLAAGGGLLLGGLMVALLSCGIDWLRELGPGTLLRLIVTATLSSLAAVFLAILYPSFTSIVASVNELLHARRIPLYTRYLDHLENPSGELVYREREQNLRLLKTATHEDAGGGLLLLKQLGDQVKRGEPVALQERFFGFMITEWDAFCDGSVVVLESNGLIGIRPDSTEEAFYPYPVSLLEAEQRRRRIHEDAVFSAHEEVVGQEDSLAGKLAEDRRRERAARRQEAALRGQKLDLQEQSRVVDHAATARAEQRQREVGRSSPRWRKLRPLLAIVGCFGFYLLLQQWIFYQSSLADMNCFHVTQVVLTNLQETIQAQGLLQPHFSIELRSPVTGQLAELFVADGDIVSRGQPLFRLGDASAQAALEQARLDLLQAQREFDVWHLQAEVGFDATLREQALNLLHKEGSSMALQREQEKLRVVAPATGTITETHVRVGDELVAGQPLFDFANGEKMSSEEKQLELLRAKASLDTAERAWQQLEIRAEYDGIVAALAVDEAQDVEAGAELLKIRFGAEMLSGAAALSLRSAELEAERLRQQLQRLMITAPCDGVLSDLRLTEGDYLDAGISLGQMSSESEFLLRCPVSQHQISSVCRGDSAAIKNLLSGQRYSGTVTEIAATGRKDPQNQSVHYEVIVRFALSAVPDSVAGQKMEVTLQTMDAVQKEIGPFSLIAEAAEIKDIVADVSGELIEVHADNGDRLSEGDVIAVLRNRNLELSTAEAEEHVEKMLRDVKHSPQQAKVAHVFVEPGERVEQGQLLLQLEDVVLQAAYDQARKNYSDLYESRLSNEVIFSRTSGTVSVLHVHPGDRVKPEQILVEIANPALEDAVEKADLDRLKGEASYQALLENPKAGMLEQARLRLEQARNAFSQREKALADLTVLALQDGTVSLAPSLLPGANLRAKQPLAWIHSDQQLTLTVAVDENQIGLITEGMSVDLQVSAYGEERWQGIVREIAAMGVVQEGRVVFMIEVVVPTDERLRSGMTATVQVLLQEAENVLALPLEYVRRERVEEEIVERVDLLVGGRLVSADVTTGLRNREMIEIVSGLREGDLVLIEKER